MPLISCPECTRQVSTEAHACPHCGFPYPARAARFALPAPGAVPPPPAPVSPPPYAVRAPVAPQPPRREPSPEERKRAAVADGRTALGIIGVVVAAVLIVLAVGRATDYSGVPGSAAAAFGPDTSLSPALGADTAFLPAYDTMAYASPPPGPADHWYASEDTSPMDGSRSVSLWTSADEEIRGWLNETHRPTLYVRCRENETDVFVVTGVNPDVEWGLFQQATVRLRLDEDKPTRQTWSESTDGKALFAPRAVTLARRLAGASTLRFEFTPFQASPQTVTFHLDGLASRLPQVAGACGWNV